MLKHELISKLAIRVDDYTKLARRKNFTLTSIGEKYYYTIQECQLIVNAIAFK